MIKNLCLLAILILIGVGTISILTKSQKQDLSLDSFAQCLAKKGITMYGANWCPHCQNEKKAFGSSFRFISYVECPDNPQRCLSANISGYPTWLFPDGRKFTGQMGLENLAKESGCQLPKSN